MAKMTVKFVIFFVVIVLVAGGAFLIFPRGKNSDTAPSGAVSVSAGGPLQDLSFQDYGGKTVKLSDFLGRPVIVNSWAAWCPFCVKELPAFAAVQKEFGDRVVIIAINRAESLETASKYSDARGVTKELVFLLDPGDSFYQAIGGFSMPETIFVNGDGRVVDHKRGPMELEEMRSRVKNAFNI